MKKFCFDCLVSIDMLKAFQQNSCTLPDLSRVFFCHEFPLNLNDEKLYGHFLGKFPENPEIVETIQRKIPEENHVGWKFLKILEYVVRLSSLLEILGNAVSFTDPWHL